LHSQTAHVKVAQAVSGDPVIGICAVRQRARVQWHPEAAEKRELFHAFAAAAGDRQRSAA
jgi:hypothetical protein